VVARVGERRAQLVTDVTGEPGVAFESFDQAAHHEVERFVELLDFLVGARHHQTSREFALGDQRRGFGDFEQGPNRAPGHQRPPPFRSGSSDRPRAHVEQQHAKGVFEVRQLEDLVDLGLHAGTGRPTTKMILLLTSIVWSVAWPPPRWR